MKSPRPFSPWAFFYSPNTPLGTSCHSPSGGELNSRPSATILPPWGSVSRLCESRDGTKGVFWFVDSVERLEQYTTPSSPSYDGTPPAGENVYLSPPKRGRDCFCRTSQNKKNTAPKRAVGELENQYLNDSVAFGVTLFYSETAPQQYASGTTTVQKNTDNIRLRCLRTEDTGLSTAPNPIPWIRFYFRKKRIFNAIKILC